MVVYGALRNVGDSLQQIEIAVLDHMTGVIRLSEQAAGTAVICSMEVDALKDFEQTQSPGGVGRPAGEYPPCCKFEPVPITGDFLHSGVILTQRADFTA